MLYDIVKDTTATLERLGEDNSIHEEAHGCISSVALRQTVDNIQSTNQVEDQRTENLHLAKSHKTTNLAGPSCSMNLAERKRVERTSDGAWISVQGKKIIEVCGITLRGNNRINDHKDNKKLDKGKALAFPQWRVSYIFNLNIVQMQFLQGVCVCVRTRACLLHDVFMYNMRTSHDIYNIVNWDAVIVNVILMHW